MIRRIINTKNILKISEKYFLKKKEAKTDPYLHDSIIYKKVLIKNNEKKNNHK